jgi:Methyltransferase domain
MIISPGTDAFPAHSTLYYGMLISTLPRLRCPSCLDEAVGSLELTSPSPNKGEDVLHGTLCCTGCGTNFPILAGVAILVGDLENYLRLHARGIASLVDEADVPEIYRDAIRQGLAESDASEEDQEAERVNALYYMNHYLQALPKNPWWRPRRNFSPEIDRLVKNFWNHGPFALIARWTKNRKKLDAIELGCSVGGLARVLAPQLRTYLGVDTSFVSIALARHLNLGAPYPLSLALPQDLLLGPQTKKLPLPRRPRGAQVDFLVAELENLPVAKGGFDLAVALNVIDVIEDPATLPAIQFELLKKNGLSIQSSPFLWNRNVAAELREILPGKIKTSSEAVVYLYEQQGFSISKSVEHVPWLFLEHFRKIGLYSLHVFSARK